MTSVSRTRDADRSLRPSTVAVKSSRARSVISRDFERRYAAGSLTEVGIDDITEVGIDDMTEVGIEVSVFGTDFKYPLPELLLFEGTPFVAGAAFGSLGVNGVNFLPPSELSYNQRKNDGWKK